MADMRCSMCGASVDFDAETLRYEPRLYTSHGRHICAACREKAMAVDRELEPEVDFGFNVGAFSLRPLWLLFNGYLVRGLLLAGLGAAAGALAQSAVDVRFPFLIQVFGWLGIVLLFGVALRYGGTGNQMLWATGRFETVSQLRENQKYWQVAGTIALILVVLMVVIQWAALFHSLSGLELD